MKGSYLIPKETVTRGLNGADLEDIHYDEAINMYFHEYKSNLEKHAKSSEELSYLLSGLALSMVKVGAAANIWNPIGWALAAVAVVIGVLSKFNVFKEKSAWDADRAKEAYNVMSVYYEEAIIGKDTGRRDAEGRKMYSGGLKSIVAVTTINDELVQGLMNDIYFDLCIYETVFEREKNKGWKSSESKASTEELYRIAKTLKDGFRGKIESYKRVYNISWQVIKVNLSEGVFDERWAKLKISQEPIGQSERNILIDMPVLSLKRKSENYGMGVQFIDFLNAAENKAKAFENAYDTDKGSMFDFGDNLFYNLHLDPQRPSDEKADKEYKDWLKKAGAYEKAVQYASLNTTCPNPVLKNQTKEQCLSSKCKTISLIINDFHFRKPPYENATAQDIVLLAKKIKEIEDQFPKEKQGRGEDYDCWRMLPESGIISNSNTLRNAFVKYGLRYEDYDNNFNLRSHQATPSLTDVPAGDKATSFPSEKGLEVPQGYTNERPIVPVQPKPAEQPQPKPSPQPSAPVQPKPQPVPQPKSSTPVQPKPQPSNTGKTEEKPTVAPEPKEQPKKGSLWWLWLLLAGGVYVATKKDKKNGK